jgi:polyisoprenyl-phosphate glycosyltransferase
VPTIPQGAIQVLTRKAGGATRLAVLCPVYNEEQAIPLFFDRVMSVFSQLDTRYKPSLYFIDNGCTDASLRIIRSFHETNANVFAIVMSRNFGYQCALETGLRTVAADLYVMIDVDCEDPPEMILDFVKQHEQGFEIVYGERVDRPEPFVLKGTRKAYYRIVRWLADDNFVLNMAEFSLITREVRNAIIQDVTSTPFLRASIGRIGFRRKNVPYRRHPRIAGKTHYNFIGMTLFGIVGILSSSTVALRVQAYALPFWILGLTAVTVSAIVSPRVWQIPVLLLLGFCFLGFTVGFSALYIARIYKNGLLRPNAIVRLGLSILPPDSQEE